jgi:hypothetical protein
MKRLAWIVLLGAALACEDNPTPGVLKVNLTTPNSGGDAAILVNISGPAALTSMSAPTGLRLFTLPPPLGTANRFVLTGTIRAGTILTIGVADVGQASAYVAAVQQVATPAYQLRALTGYSLKVAP